MKLFLVFLFFVFLNQLSVAQTVVSLDYIDHQNKDEQSTQIYSHQNNNYIISSTETSQFSNEYTLSVTKTEKQGAILWTKYHRPGANSYHNFTTNKVQFKDSVILIYGICRDEINKVRKFFLVLNLEGVELASKIFPFTNSVIQFHVSLSDSNTVECVYFDYEPSRLIHYEQYNKKFELIHSDSLVNNLKTTNFRAYNSSVYALNLYESTTNKLTLKLFHFNKNFDLIDSSIFNTDIPIYPTAFKTYEYANVGISLDSNVLFIEGAYDFNSNDWDSYFLRVDLKLKQLVEHYYLKKNSNEQYSISNMNTKYLKYKNDIFCLNKLYRRDSVTKYILQLNRISNGNSIWKRIIDIPFVDSSLAGKTNTNSLEMINNKVIAGISYVYHYNLGQSIYQYDINGSYLYNFHDYIDTSSDVSSVIKTFYASNSELITLANTLRPNKFDYDLLWKKTVLNTTGTTIEQLQTTYVFPNPSKDYLTIEGIKIPDGTLECMDVLGIKYYVNIVNNKINTSNLYPGLYFIYIRDKNLKFIKSNY